MKLLRSFGAVLLSSLLIVSTPTLLVAAPVVIPGQESPGDIKKRLDNGTILGGRPVMPPQRRMTKPASVAVTTVAENLKVPWGMDFGPDGRLFFTERPGNVKVLDPNKGTVKKLFEPPNTLHWGEGGLMGIALHPEFPSTPVLFLSQTYGSTLDPANRIIEVTLTGDGIKTAPLIDGIPAASYHNGSRLEFGPEGYLYATTGDAGEPGLAQDLNSWAGKILRFTIDGEPAPDNPFDGNKAKPYVYSYGHRNPQGLAWHPETDQLYASEHGPSGEFGLSGNDEINRIVKGGNYGWPRIVGAPGVEPYRDPILHFPDPHLPPAGAAFYGGSHRNWSGNLFVGSLYGALVLRVGFTDEHEPKFIHRWFEDEFFEGRYGRIRAVEMGPGNSLYVSTSNRDGRGNPAPNDDRILKLTPTE